MYEAGLSDGRVGVLVLSDGATPEAPPGAGAAWVMDWPQPAMAATITNSARIDPTQANAMAIGSSPSLCLSGINGR